MSLSGFDEISEAVFEAGRSLTKKAEQERKRLQNAYIFVGLSAGSQNVRESVCVCVVSVSENVKENEFLEDESMYWQSLSCGRLQMHRQNQSCIVCVCVIGCVVKRVSERDNVYLCIA